MSEPTEAGRDREVDAVGARPSRDAIRCIVYVSRAVGVWSDADLRNLAASASRQNAALGVTGRLLHLNGGFIQVFEGPWSGVQTVWDRIAGDGRHKDVKQLLDAHVANPYFADWSMDYVPADVLSDAEAFLARSIQSGEPDDKEAVGRRARALLARMGRQDHGTPLKTHPVQSRSVDTVTGILDAARAVLLRHGEAELTHRSIANEAGISVKSVYRYFSSVDDIARASVRRRQTSYLASYRQRLVTLRFPSRAALSEDLADVLCAAYLSDESLAYRIRIAVLRRFHDIPYAELWQMADDVLAAIIRSGLDTERKCTKVRIAMALASCGASAKMCALHAPELLRTGFFRESIVRTMMVAFNDME